MATVEAKIKRNDPTSGGNNTGKDNYSGGGGDDGNNGNNDDSDGNSSRTQQPPKHQPNPMLFLIFAMIPITIFFAAIVFVYLAHEMRKGWTPIAMPSAIMFSTLVLIISSISLEMARKSLKLKLLENFKRWVMLSTVLGITFFATQLIAWKQLMAKGVYVEATNPHATFFYVLTSAHALHLSVGLIGLCYVLFGAIYYRFNAERRNAVDVTTVYWHFMDGLWIFLFLLLFVWK
jgi:cytochrome c oxidase subunit III